MKEKENCKNKIRKVGHTIGHLPENVQVFTYVALYRTLQELHFQKKYKLVSDLCDALLKDRNLI